MPLPPAERILVVYTTVVVSCHRPMPFTMRPTPALVMIIMTERARVIVTVVVHGCLIGLSVQLLDQLLGGKILRSGTERVFQNIVNSGKITRYFTEDINDGLYLIGVLLKGVSVVEINPRYPV